LRIADCGLRIVLIEKSFINWKSEIRNRQSAIKGYSVVNKVLEFFFSLASYNSSGPNLLVMLWYGLAGPVTR